MVVVFDQIPDSKMACPVWLRSSRRSARVCAPEATGLVEHAALDYPKSKLKKVIRRTPGSLNETMSFLAYLTDGCVFLLCSKRSGASTALYIFVTPEAKIV
jgi:hypothetical protein